MGEARASRSDYTPSEDDNMLVTGIAEEKYALGYFGCAYYEENRDRLKLVGIDPGDGNCVLPSQETVNNNTYRPLSRPLFIYVSKQSLRQPEVKSFVEYYLDNAAKLAPEVGFVAAPSAVAANNRRLFGEAVASLPDTL